MKALRHLMFGLAASAHVVVSSHADENKAPAAQLQVAAIEGSQFKKEPPLEERVKREPPLEEPANESGTDGLSQPSLIVLSPTQPLFFRIDIRIRGEQGFVPLMKSWSIGSDNEFKRLDKNGNGRLSVEELARASWHEPSRPDRAGQTGVGRFFSRLFATNAGDSETEQPVEIGRAQFETLRRRAASPINLGAHPQRLDRVDRMWQILDATRDQVLTAEEWKSAGARVARLDVNADGLVQEAELFAYDNPSSLNRAVGGQGLAPSNDFYWLSWPAETRNQENLSGEAWESGKQAARSLADRYNTMEKCQAMRDNAVWKGKIERYDASGNGILDVDEWLSLLTDGEMPTVAHLSVSLAPAQGPQPIEIVNGVPRPATSRLNTVKLVAEGDARLRVWANPAWIRVQGAGLSIRFATSQSGGFDPLQNVIEAFDGAVDKAKGYMDRQESQRQFPLNVMFEPADADKDGKLYREELVEFVGQVREQSSRSVDVSVSPQGRQLFHCLDTNGDGRVGVEERRDAAKTLEALDVDQNGRLQVTELPETYDVAINVSRPKILSAYYVQGGADALPAPSVPAADVPGWFKLLDRNNDHLLERWEYPGVGARFAEMDLDHDGVVSVAEAKKVGVKRRPKDQATGSTPVASPRTKPAASVSKE